MPSAKKLHWTQTPEGKAKLASRKQTRGQDAPEPAFVAEDPYVGRAMDAQRLLRAAQALLDVGGEYTTLANQLVKDATRMLNRDGDYSR